MAIKRAVAEATPPVHPYEEDLSFLYGTIFTSARAPVGVDGRHVCVFADGEVDRSPTGTGVSARIALLHAAGDMPVGRPVRIDSIVGSVFEGEAHLETTFGPHAAVIPRVRGRAWVCGKSEWVMQADDPFARGFFLR
jgi:trans-L-3-hydroxyproline dehydratase